MSDAFKVCPSCDEEYTTVPTHCVDCGALLIHSDDIEPEIPASEFPAIEKLACLRVGPLPWSQALSNALTEAKLAHRIERDTRTLEEGGVDPRHFDGETVYGVWVRPQDTEAAGEVSKVVFAHIDADSDEAPSADADEQCPACQSPLPIDARECPDCGLPFG